ncbi:MAG: hypothetical protein ACTHQQ_14300 [Solirubrobacteraceae bacterium]
MLRLTRCAPIVVSAATLAVSAPPALAAANPSSNGCTGNIIASFNQNSGIYGASGNPNASAGPGHFIGGQSPGSVADAVHSVQSAFC